VLHRVKSTRSSVGVRLLVNPDWSTAEKHEERFGLCARGLMAKVPSHKKSVRKSVL
jgi:hypothetical protein